MVPPNDPVLRDTLSEAIFDQLKDPPTEQQCFNGCLNHIRCQGVDFSDHDYGLCLFYYGPTPIRPSVRKDVNSVHYDVIRNHFVDEIQGRNTRKMSIFIE